MTLQLTHPPTPGRLVQPFGPRPKPTPTSPAIHYGEDWGWKDTPTDPVWAPAAGTVVAVADAGAYGLRVRVRVGDGLELWFCHLSAASVAAGDVLDVGDQVGRIGSSGNVTGPHLHMELRARGVAIDPAPYWTAAAPAGSTPEPIEGEDMEHAIVCAPNGVVVLLRGNGRTGYRQDFKNPAEYNLRRDITAALRKAGATSLPALPPLDAVPDVTWEHHAAICGYLGAPLK